MPTARELGRAELTSSIQAVARRQLAEVGAAALSLRAVARELDLASSAIYRYFPSRDELLTALIVDAYDALGAAAERADAYARRRGASLADRLLAVARALRRHAVEHPAEYALVFGSPVPGYVAPQRTLASATRVTDVLAAILQEATAAQRTPPAATGGGVSADLAALQARRGTAIAPGLLERGIVIWTSLFGAISFEIFGHYANSVDGHPEEWFDAMVRTLSSLALT